MSFAAFKKHGCHTIANREWKSSDGWFWHFFGSRTLRNGYTGKNSTLTFWWNIKINIAEYTWNISIYEVLYDFVWIEVSAFPQCYVKYSSEHYNTVVQTIFFIASSTRLLK